MHCGDLSIPLQGTISTSEDTCGSHVHYDCNPGFKLIGSASRDCHGNGSWDGVEPICVGKSAPFSYFFSE